MDIKILHINDLHSRYEELAKISTAINTARNENTIILDGGDNADFARIETLGTMGRISSAILNEIGFDARVYGNNEGFSEQENMKTIKESSSFPCLVCNMYNGDGTRFEGTEDAVIKETGGARFLIIGVTAPFNEFYNLFGIYMRDPIDEVRRVIASCDKADYDFIIALSHLGLERDRMLAEAVGDIDVIIGGHSHTVMEKPELVNNAIIFQAGSYGEYLGELNLKIDDKEKKIMHYSGRLINCGELETDKRILDIIHEYSDIADKNLSKPIFEIKRDMGHSIFGENEMGNLLADALKDVLDTEIGIIHSGILNNGIERGFVSEKLLLKTCPSPLNPTRVEVRGEDILTTLEKSLISEHCNSDGRGAGFRGKYIGGIQVSGNVKIQYDPSGEPLKKIISVTIDGKPLDVERWYTAGTSDYLQRGTGYSEFGKCRNEKYNPEYIRETLKTYLQKEDFLDRAFNKRFMEV